jgi:thymidylate synthase (FAD)
MANKEELQRRKAFPSVQTRRPISEGGEHWIGRKIPVLDHGFVYLVDYMGNDESVVQAARVSYGKGTRKTSESQGLIRYLMRHHHTTPSEMVEAKFHAKMPIFVARQWVRHRTASINEYSARYSILDREFYIPAPEVLAAQSTSNRQGRGEVLDAVQAEDIRQLLIEDANRAYDHYEYLLNDDGDGKPKDPERDMLSRELSRMDLTLNYYTQWYWKANLHNIFNFLRLRMDSHAQYEVRVYADAIAQVMQAFVPIAWVAFNDFVLESAQFSGPEMKALGMLLQAKNMDFDDVMIREVGNQQNMSKREQIEFSEKIKRLNV